MFGNKSTNNAALHFYDSAVLQKLLLEIMIEKIYILSLQLQQTNIWGPK